MRAFNRPITSDLSSFAVPVRALQKDAEYIYIGGRIKNSKASLSYLHYINTSTTNATISISVTISIRISVSVSINISISISVSVRVCISITTIQTNSLSSYSSSHDTLKPKMHSSSF